MVFVREEEIGQSERELWIRLSLFALQWAFESYVTLTYVDVQQIRMKTGRTPQLVAETWGSLESCTIHSFTQHFSSWSSVTCQAWWQFLSSEFVSLFTAAIWTALLAACPSALPLDLCRVRLQHSCHVQRVRLAFFLLLNNRLSGWCILLFLLKGRSSQGRIPHIPGAGGLRGDGHNVLTCALPVSILHVDQFFTSCFPRTPRSVGRSGPLGKAHCSPHGPWYLHFCSLKSH